MEAATLHKKRKSWKLLIPCIIFLCAAVLIYLGWKSHIDQQRELKWPMTTGRIKNWEIRHIGKFRQVFFTGTMHLSTGDHSFNFRWDNAEWKNNNWLPKKGAPKVGDSLIIRYNPENPSEVVRKEVPSAKFVFLGLGSFLLFISLILFAAILNPTGFRMNRHDRRKKNKQP